VSATFDVVIPTSGRASLGDLVVRLVELGVAPERIRVIDDSSRGAGPAQARNLGWSASSAQWIVFLDDDVLPDRDWLASLERDLNEAEPDVAGVQAQIAVPLPEHRPPSDWERNVHGLESAVWATADMAYRRAALQQAGGFDERFPRAFREDADLGLRLVSAGWRIARGSRRTVHPVGADSFWGSVRRQRGNADDALMRRLHGADWQRRAHAPAGRRPFHLALTGLGAAAIGSLALRRRRAAALLGAGWLAGIAALALERIAPGPRTRGEVGRMAVTSALIPAAATYWWLVGLARTARVEPARARPGAVLLDRDGTLVVDVPYNGDPDRVRPLPGVRSALERLRRAGVPTAVVSNQSGIGRGLLTHEQLAAVNSRVEELLGPLGPWFVCPHDPAEQCGCRKPSPALVYEAAEALGVEPGACALVGDIGSDVEAAAAAGARGILVPTGRTRAEEIAAAPEVAGSLEEAVDLLLGGRP
jgi:histidinol-phosphate phosphatase family protein